MTFLIVQVPLPNVSLCTFLIPLSCSGKDLNRHIWKNLCQNMSGGFLCLWDYGWSFLLLFTCICIF